MREACLAHTPNYPNPFNPDTWIPCKLIEDFVVVIKIYDVNGRLVRKLEPGHKAAGVYVTKDRAAYWDGRIAPAKRSPVASISIFLRPTDSSQ